MRYLLRLPVALGLTLALSGCPARPQSVDPLAVMTWHGQAVSISAKILVKATPPGGESFTTTVYLWQDGDGRARVLVTKVDQEVLQLLIQADGAFDAWAPRSGLRTHGELADPDLPREFADIRLLLSELRDGPAAPALNLKPGPAANTLVGRSGSYQATLGVAGEEITTKTLSDEQGAQVYQVTYSRYRSFDDLHRPTRVETRTADGARTVANLISFDSLGGISAQRMRLTIPDAARAVSPREFLEHLDG